MKRQRLFTRNFTLLILGQVTSLIGNYSLKFALSMYILEMTGSAAVFSGMLALSMVPTILLSPFGGILADRGNRRKIMVTLDTLSGIVVLSGMVCFREGWELAAAGGILIVLSVLGAFESPTVQACVPQMLSGDLLLKGNAAVSQVQALAALFTPFLGSIFYTALGIRPVFAAVILCFFLTACFECFIRLEPLRQREKKRGSAVIREEFSVSIHFLGKENTGVLKLLLLATLVSLFVAGILIVGFPYLVRTTLGLSAGHYGAAESAMGAAAILGACEAGFLGDKLRTGHLYRLIAAVGGCLFLSGLAFLLPAGVVVKYLILTAAFGGCQLFCNMFSIYALSVIQKLTPAQLTGKVMACVYTLSTCAQPLGQLLYGGLFDRFSSAVAVVLIPSGLVVAAIGMAAAGFFRKTEQEIIRKP